MLSPPQNCLKIVDFTIFRIGKPKLNAKLVATFPIFTMLGEETILNNQYALFKSGVDLLLKAISVFSKDNMAQK
jgi:hypothetical protein